MPRLWIDLETYSRVDLRTATPYRYSEDPEFRILLASYSVDGEHVYDLEGHDHALATLELLGLFDPDVLKIAHNAAFERVVLSTAAGFPVGTYLPPEQWHDPQAVAAEQGLPQKLGKLATALGAEEKDEAGTALINWFCKPDRRGNRRLPEDHPEKWAAFKAYCHQDVVTLIDVDRRLGGFPTATERDVYLADQAVNDTGLLIDRELAELAVAAAEDNRMEQELQIQAMTGVDNPGSQPQMMEWCASVGLPNADLQKTTVEDLLEGDLHPDVRTVLELRQELALVASKKFSAALDAVSGDDRLRGSFRFFGAHTGRWTGRGAQPQNLPREAFDNPVDVELAVQELRDGRGATALDLKRLVRPMFLGPMVVVDYAAIEARVIAWLAGEQWALDAFAQGRDIYVETAKRMGGLTRAQGKIAVLALGFAGGVGSLKVMGGSDIYYHNGVPVTGGTTALSPDELVPINDDQLQKMVDQWRRANRNIVRLWSAVEDAFGDTGAAGPRLRVTHSQDSMGRAVHLHLPSGRAISYHNVKWERYTVKDPRTERLVRKEGWRYADPRNPFSTPARIGTYGGRLAENATQAVARDILGEALVRLVEHGYRVVAHVHDEVLVEGDDLAGVTKLMTEPPSWATGLPIDAEGQVTARYAKG